MNKTLDVIVSIEKEFIEKLNFPEQEVLLTPEEINHRQYEAQRAMKLGNYFQDKVKIIFEDSEGMKMVETTIWGVTDKRLLLKRGLMIPLHRIHDIVI
ncbi:MAG TPA: hypothetical protein VK783_14525 [Bacteroidia bacterium]|jgi:hypothetical protein|nr:hypothetical protein [Bacteroidia bacterium]